MLAGILLAGASTSTSDAHASCASSLSCGGRSPDGCWCDLACSRAGDCCPSFIADCPLFRPDLFPSADDLHLELQQLAAAHGGFIATDLMGYSLEGRPIVAYRLGAPGRASRPKLLVTAGAHGNEVLPIAVARELIYTLLERRNDDPRIAWIMRDLEIVVVPLVNPDGYMAGYPYVGTRWNARGVDLNRNQTYGFVPGGWAGERALSEPESRFVSWKMQELFPSQYKVSPTEPSHPDTAGMVIDLHGYGDGVFVPYGGFPCSSGPADLGALLHVARDMAEAPLGSSQLGCNMYNGTPWPGSVMDAAHGHFGVAAFTVELDDDFAFVDHDELLAHHAGRAIESILRGALYARRSISSPKGPLVSEFYNQLRLWWLDDLRAISWWDLYAVARARPGTTVALANVEVYRRNGPTWASECQATMYARDGAFDEAEEAVGVDLPTACIRRNEWNLVVMRSRSSSGIWGPAAPFFAPGGS